MPKVEQESAAPPKPRPLGPNLKRLISYKMAKDAISDGGGFADGVKFLTTPGAMAAGWREATAWVDQAIVLVRNAAEPNPWKNATEEEIAGELLRKIELRRRERGTLMPHPKWIRFEKLPRIYKQVTDRWLVVTLSGEPLGTVKWYSPWRQYSFCPQPATVFERTCLRDIADFCEKETAEKRRKLAEFLEVGNAG